METHDLQLAMKEPPERLEEFFNEWISTGERYTDSTAIAYYLAWRSSNPAEDP